MLVLDHPEEGTVEAETHYRVLEESALYSLVELELKTGKMHQIRAQLAHLSHPVAGDRVYGDAQTNNKYAQLLRRQFLHAIKVQFKHPYTQQELTITAPLPEDLEHMMEKAGISFSLESYGKVK